MKDYITVQSGIGGYFAVYMTYEEECECYMPWQTGFGHYARKENAIEEARDWAEAEGIACEF